VVVDDVGNNGGDYGLGGVSEELERRSVDARMLLKLQEGRIA